MNTPEQNIINTLQGKRVLFIENDSALNDLRLKEFATILDSANIPYDILYNVTDVARQDINDVIDPIMKADVIVFMTQWVYKIAEMLKDFIAELPTKKIIVEVYIRDPSWYYASQHGTHHDVYVYTCMKWGWDVPKEKESFYKLTDKPYWDYKNKFDK